MRQRRGRERNTRQGCIFSEASMRKCKELPERQVATLRLALNAFSDGGMKTMSMLRVEKVDFRDRELRFLLEHRGCRACRIAESSKTSSARRDMVNDFERVAWRPCAFVHLIPEDVGTIAPSHLRENLAKGVNRCCAQHPL